MEREISTKEQIINKLKSWVVQIVDTLIGYNEEVGGIGVTTELINSAYKRNVECEVEGKMKWVPVSNWVTKEEIEEMVKEEFRGRGLSDCIVHSHGKHSWYVSKKEYIKNEAAKVLGLSVLMICSGLTMILINIGLRYLQSLIK